MKRQGVLLLPPGWDAIPSQGYPQHIFWYPFVHLGEEKHCEIKIVKSRLWQETKETTSHLTEGDSAVAEKTGKNRKKEEKGPEEKEFLVLVYQSRNEIEH